MGRGHGRPSGGAGRGESVRGKQPGCMLLVHIHCPVVASITGYHGHALAGDAGQERAALHSLPRLLLASLLPLLQESAPFQSRLSREL